MTRTALARRLPIGAEPLPGGGVHFRIWAPKRRRVAVALFDSPQASTPTSELELEPEPGGYFSGTAEDAAPGVQVRDMQDTHPAAGRQFVRYDYLPINVQAHSFDKYQVNEGGSGRQE